MPVYEFKCNNNHSFTRFLRLADFNETQICKRCGQVAERQISAPMVVGDLPPYDCPITGKLIEGRKAHEDNLKRHGCRVFEAGETQDFKKRKASEEEALFKQIDASVEEFVSKATPEKREALGKELQLGVSANYGRGE